jgi:hypothetical protein
MDKISGILSSSPRIQKADVSSSQPARPGAPMTGRPEGKNSLGDRITLSKEAEKIRKAGAAAEMSKEVSLGQSETSKPVASKNNLTQEVAKKEPAIYKNTSENAKLKIIEDLNKKFFSNPKDLVNESTRTTKSEDILENIDDTVSLKDTGPLVQQESPDLPESKDDTPL